jgi:hypothetical protein
MRGQAFPTLTSPWVVPQISDVSPRPASAYALSLVQTSVVTSDYPVVDCAICLEPVKKGQTVAVMPCEGRHSFHKDCVLEWLKKRNTCPNCRFALEPEPEPDQDELNDSMTGWIRYTDFHDYQNRLLLTDPQYQRLAGHIPMAQPIPVAEALPWASEEAAPWVDDAQLARARHADYDDDGDDELDDGRWGVGLGVGTDVDGAIVVTHVVRGGPAEGTGQARRHPSILPPPRHLHPPTHPTTLHPPIHPTTSHPSTHPSIPPPPYHLPTPPTIHPSVHPIMRRRW